MESPKWSITGAGASDLCPC